VAAVLLAFGSPHAHNVILLRAKGFRDRRAGTAVLSIPDGTVVAVDGGRGEFVVAPAQDARRGFESRVATLAQRQRRLTPVPPNRPHRDGVTIPVGANIGSVDDAARRPNTAPISPGCPHGIPILGRQHAPMSRSSWPCTARSRVPRWTADHVANFGCRRDKRWSSCRRLPNESLSGRSGIRLSLAHPELLVDQLLAIVRWHSRHR